MGQPFKTERKSNNQRRLSENRTVPSEFSVGHAVGHQNMRPLVDIGEVARLLAVSKMTVRRLVSAGNLPCVRLTTSHPMKFDLRDVERFIQEHKGWGE